MTNKVTLELHEHLPMPLIFLATAEDLARWQMDQLCWAYGQGHRALALSCFDATAMGFDNAQAAFHVLRMTKEFLLTHDDVTSLAIRCGDETTYRAYSHQLSKSFSIESKP